ncbi:putative transglycosylase IsaA [Oenococcus oeni]|nr:hypothetical protein [Oenococcus oeni]SYW07526.1 putative transglycosylase IsaA [Oenococcus oeni]SYW10689.1 putative transglycosylase IsaA [Oenococcus oeni]
MGSGYFYTKKVRRLVKALIVLACFAAFSFLIPSTVGKADHRDASANSSFSVARGLARSIGQTAATFNPPASTAKSKKDKTSTGNTLQQLDYAKSTVQNTTPLGNNVSYAATSSSQQALSSVQTSSQSSSSSISESSYSSSTATGTSMYSESQNTAQRSSVSSSYSYAAKISSSSSIPQTSVSSSSSSSSISSGSDDINWLISRESSGNPNAVNGSYKGIGQLSEAAYETYLGMTWDQVKGNYQLQLKAMQAYISARYGSVSAAISFWQQNGWY